MAHNLRTELTMTTSHELAKRLLALPNLPLTEDAQGYANPIVVKIIDENHPNFEPYQSQEDYHKYWERMPKTDAVAL
jgi:hypothetical protein